MIKKISVYVFMSQYSLLINISANKKVIIWRLLFSAANFDLARYISWLIMALLNLNMNHSHECLINIIFFVDISKILLHL